MHKKTNKSILNNLHYEKFSDGTVKCIEDEIPFDVPNGWAWCRLGNLFKHNTGKALNSSKSEGTILTYITTSNVYWDRFELDNLKSMPFTESEIEKCTVKKGDLLVCEGGDIGRAAIWNRDEDIRIQNHIHRLRPYAKINCQFYYYILYLYKLNGKINGNGIGLQGLSSNALHSIIVPLPPINEQAIITSRLKQIFTLVSDIETKKADLSIVLTAMKSKILDLAIRGKLVTQNPEDEPASVLLERIKAEKEELIEQGKIKRDKKESVIFKGDDNSYYEKIGNIITSINDEIPFEIPENWSWCRLNLITSTITDYVANGSFATLKANTTIYKEKNYALFVRTVDFANNFKKDLVYIDKKTYDFLEKSKLYGNELMLSNIGASIGKVFKIPQLDIPMSLAPNSIILKFYDGIDTDFFEYLFKSFVGQNYLKKLSSGAAMPKFNKTDLKVMLVPIPPQNEQLRIVNKIILLFELLLKIEQNLI